MNPGRRNLMMQHQLLQDLSAELTELLRVRTILLLTMDSDAYLSPDTLQRHPNLTGASPREFDLDIERICSAIAAVARKV